MAREAMGRKSTKIRKAKITPERTPSMRPSRAQEDYGRDYSPTEVRRLRDAAMRGLRDAEWGTELGGLYLERKITAAMYGAGKWWREMAVAHLSAINAPCPTPRRISLEGSMGGTAPDPDSDEGLRIAARERDTLKLFNAAHKELIAAGMLAEHYVRELCEENLRPFGSAPMAATVAGLQRLVDWRDRELTNKSKSNSGR